MSDSNKYLSDVLVNYDYMSEVRLTTVTLFPLDLSIIKTFPQVYYKIVSKII